jgi:hypothetical protein
MAKPPEPLEEIFPQTSIIVDAEVKEVKSTDPDDDPRSQDNPRQVVVLTVKKLVRGALNDNEKKAQEIVATKPKAPYVVKAGTKGAFLLTGDRTILGRYGPDSWRMDKVETKLAELKPKNLAP